MKKQEVTINGIRLIDVSSTTERGLKDQLLKC